MENKYTKQTMIKDIIVFITVCCLALALLSNGFVCYAADLEEEQTNNSFSGLYGYDFSQFGLWNSQGYNDSFLYDSDVYLPYDYVSPITQTLLDTFDLSEYYQTYPYFVFTQDYSNRNLYYLYLFSEPSMFVLYGNHSVGVRGSGSWLFLELNNSGSLLVLSDSTTYSGDLVMSSSYTHRFVFSNIDVYGTTTNVSGDGLLSTSDYSNINYCIYNENGDLIYNNPITGGSYGENIEKGLYLLKGSSIYLSNKSFSDGTLYINALLSDNQKSNNNLELVIRATCTYSFSCTSDTLLNPRIYISGYGSDFQSVQTLLWGNSINYPLSKTVVCDRFGNLGFYPISISDLNNGTYTIDFDTVNRNLLTSTLPNNTFMGANIAPLASVYSSSNRGNFIIKSFNVNSSNSGVGINPTIAYLDSSEQKTDVILTDVRYHFELYMVDTTDSNNYEWSDVLYSYDADLINGTSNNSDGTLTYTDLNTYFDDNVPSGYLPSNDTSTNDINNISSGGSGGTLINNDNDTITIESNGEIAEQIVDDLLPSTENEWDFVERIEEYTDSNDFLALIQNTYSFVPQSVFNYMKFYFEVALGILACAFILRIVLDLL